MRKKKGTDRNIQLFPVVTTAEPFFVKPNPYLYRWSDYFSTRSVKCKAHAKLIFRIQFITFESVFLVTVN